MLEKIVKVSDAVIDCIPGLSLVSNAFQILYKSARKVDALNPVAPGLKTSIKIHVLSKSDFRHMCGCIPVLGNILALLTLIADTITGFRDENLQNAIRKSDTEVVHLSIGNKPLEGSRGNLALWSAAFFSRPETFKEVLNSRNDWSVRNLMSDMEICCRQSNYDRIANADAILDYMNAHRIVPGERDKGCANVILTWLQPQVAFANRIRQMFPAAQPVEGTLGGVSYNQLKGLVEYL